jgi:NtrC-family two-component system sensor histidine kinase KinB
MFSLRRKLLLGFGGLLAILLVVGGLGIVLIDRHSRTLDQIFRENYASVVYGQVMKEAVEELGGIARALLWKEGGAGRETTGPVMERFERNLALERANVTVPGEEEVARKLAAAWGAYKDAYGRAVTGDRPEIEARASYSTSVVPLAKELRALSQEVIDLNVGNMFNVDGQVKREAAGAKRAMLLLLALGLSFGAAFVAVMGRSILRPIRALTASARDIEGGNLDLVVPVRSKDELGQLAEAFNSMAARLREFRRSDRARFVRTLRTTQLAIDSLPDAVALLGPDGRVEQSNDAAARFFGLAPGADAASLPVKGLAEVYRRAAEEVRPVQPDGYDAAIQVWDGGGQERFFLPQAVPILDEEKRLVGVTLVLADVTHLRRLDEMKSGLVSVVSHELKTPLTSIRMGLHLLLDERLGPLNEKQSDLLIAARDDSDRLHRLIEGLLEMGRLRSGRPMLEMRPIPSEEVVDEAAGAFEAAFRDKGVKLASEVSPEVGPILADRVRIGLVVSNLLGNALKFTAPGGCVRISVRPGEGDDRDRVVFLVEDTGIGIPPESLPHVFERFFRAPGQKEGMGAGLGLAIAKEVVEAHGGRIWAESRPGAGSKFGFTVPAVEAGKGIAA